MFASAKIESARRWLKVNYLAGLANRPLVSNWKLNLLVMAYICCALLIGFYSKLFTPSFLSGPSAFYIPITMFVFPAFLEESFFRGILIRIDSYKKSKTKILKSVFISTALFVAWHPLNALTINPGAVGFFLNPYFLLITAILGVACSFLYIFSRSLWMPILLHWATVLVWVMLLGGRNKLLEM